MSLSGDLRGGVGFVPSWTLSCGDNPTINEILDEIDSNFIPEIEAFLGFGSAGQVLATNAGGDGYEWIAGGGASWGSITGTLSSQTDLQSALDLKDKKPIEVTVTTAAATATKVGTTSGGSYTPTYGDRLNITFTLGCNANNPTLNIDGSGAVNIRLGNVNVTTSLLGIAAAIVVPVWFDGTYYQIYGSFHNTNTTYTEISEANIINATNATAGLITGRRLFYWLNNLLFGTTTVVSNASITPTGGNKNNELFVSALAVNTTINAPSGTPLNGNSLLIRIKDNGTARAITLNVIFKPYVPVPATTTPNKTLYIGAKYNSTDSSWDIIAVTEEL